MIAIRLTDADLEALERISEREDLPVAHLVRQGIRTVIQKRKKK